MTNQVERILTTHTGSLPRPPDLLAMIQAKETGQPYDAEELAAAVRRSVAETVREQAASGGGHRQRRRVQQGGVFGLH